MALYFFMLYIWEIGSQGLDKGNYILQFPKYLQTNYHCFSFYLTPNFTIGKFFEYNII